MATQPAALPPNVFGVFCDAINQASVQRIFNTFGIASNAGVRHIHLMFQSSGGGVNDGVALYNFFRAAPIAVTLYNCGAVQSIAAVAFMGARHRKVSASGVFQIHQTTGPQLAANATQLEAILESVRQDDARTQEILRRHITLADTEWAQWGRRDLNFAGQEAVNRGFADEIGEFSPPLDSTIFNI